MSLKMDRDRTLLSLTFILNLCKVISWSAWIALCGDIRNAEISGFLKFSQHNVSEPFNDCHGITTGKSLLSIIPVLTWIKDHPWVQLLTEVMQPKNCHIDLLQFESGAHNSCRDERSFLSDWLSFHHNEIRSLPKSNSKPLFHWQRGFCKRYKICKHEVASKHPLH